MKNLFWVLAALLIFSLGYLAGGLMAQLTAVCKSMVTDTTFVRLPVPIDSTVLRYETVKLPVSDTLYLQGKDTVRIDSIFVEVPIQQKEYQDSVYHIWISGYRPNLDSVEVYQRTTTKIQIYEKPCKWGLGVSFGLGYTGQRSVQPYVGVGLSYNIMSW